jgi:GNAT superfamily N-acetyltransferase
MTLPDAPVLSRAFAGIGWSKPVDQFERYFREQCEGRREVLVACLGDRLAGYVTINWVPTYPPLAADDVPELEDLNVLPPFRRRGIATRLVDRAEQIVAHRCDEVGIGVGLHPGYNAAQRMYVLRGYVPDGNGITVQNQPVREGQTVVLDDDIVLHLVKRL